MKNLLFNRTKLFAYSSPTRTSTVSKSRKGFTLLELLVVISIIAILVALGVVSFTTAQKKGRDARRRGDMKAMQQMMEQYYSANNSAYPAEVNCSNVTILGMFVGGSFPVDPKTGSAYTAACTTSTYCICTQLESTATGGNATNATCTYGAGTYFCVANQQ
jgi:prepilin-type N-terminal cleavage/methylation domain-containing protein